jgi:hypothetical protein
MVEHFLTAIVYPDKVDYVAQCLDVDVASRGKTESEAATKIWEDVKQFFKNYVPDDVDPADVAALEEWKNAGLNLRVFGLLP